jgi:hypothetical protein
MAGLKIFVRQPKFSRERKSLHHFACLSFQDLREFVCKLNQKAWIKFSSMQEPNGEAQDVLCALV